MKNEILLGVNIDHIASLRQARGTLYPDPVHAAFIAEQAGADAITLHLREDRRHIQERDLDMIMRISQTRVNLEMAVTDDMLDIAVSCKPHECCLVPERREELTTEGGLDIKAQQRKIKDACMRLADAGVRVSLFIDADPDQIDAALETGAPVIEIHTGHYADAATKQQNYKEYEKIVKAVQYADNEGLRVNAGHGLHYHNVKPIAAIPQIRELNIGHAIIAQALFTGLDTAVRDMKKLMQEARILGV